MERQQRLRALLKQVKHTPLPHRVPAAMNAKRGLHQREGREARRIPDRAPKPTFLIPRNPNKLNATLTHANRGPILNNLPLINPVQPKRRLEHITARNQANGKQVVRPDNLNNDNNI
jgi:hypothetical protein